MTDEAKKPTKTVAIENRRDNTLRLSYGVTLKPGVNPDVDAAAWKKTRHDPITQAIIGGGHIRVVALPKAAKAKPKKTAKGPSANTGK